MNSLHCQSLLLVAALLLDALIAPVSAAPVSTANGANKASPHPDLSGWWGTDLEAFSKDVVSDLFGSPPPLKPEGLARYQTMLERIKSGGDLSADLGPGYYCKPYLFSGFMVLGPEVEFEFLFTPKRVTITTEFGNLWRVDLSGRPLPEAVDESPMGTSVGHWEGQTLVMETTGLSSRAQVIAIANVAQLGRNARSIQRFHLKSSDILQVDSELVAPDALTAPYRMTSYFRRDAGHVPHDFSLCQENDRSIDPDTGKQRFDMQPPEDLPPPPR